MVLQFMLEGPRPCTILCFNVHTAAEYVNRNLFYWLKSTKTYKKEVLSGFTIVVLYNYTYSKHSLMPVNKFS